MNYKLLGAIFAILLLSLNVSALSVPDSSTDFGDWTIIGNGNWNYPPVIDVDYVSATLNRDTYMLQRGDELKIDVTFKRVCSNNDSTDVFSQLYVEDDEQDYFETKRISREFSLKCGETKKVRFKVNVNNDTPPQDTYTFYFKYHTANNSNFTEEKEITVNVDNFEDIDVRLQKDTFCYNQDSYETYLVYNNDSAEDYIISTKVKSNELWPNIPTKKVEVKSYDEKEKVYLKLNRKVSVGDYNLKIDTTVWKEGDTLYKNPINFQKDLTVHIVDCKKSNAEFEVSNLINDVKLGQEGLAYLNVLNKGQEELPVELRVNTDDKSLVLVLETKSKILKAGDLLRDTLHIRSTKFTSPGIKTITLSLITPYQTITRNLVINVEESDLTSSYKVVKTQVGLKAVEEVILTNHSAVSMNLTLNAISGDNDLLTLNNNVLSLAPGESKSVLITISPKTEGYKKYNLQLRGDMTKDIELYYSVSGKAPTPMFVSNYTRNYNADATGTNNISVIVSNPYNFSETLTLGLDKSDLFKYTPQTVVLKPGETKVVNIPYFLGSVNAGNYSANVVVSSDLGTNTLPIKVRVKPDLTNMSALTIIDMPVKLTFVKGEDTTYKFKVHNPNNMVVSNAVLQIKNGLDVLSMVPLTLNPNEDKEVEIVLNTDTNEFIGTVSVGVNDKTSDYTVTFTTVKSNMAGLFGLGFGSTLGIILGLIIVLLVIVLLVLNSKENKIEESKM